jgi:hypothetical protein
VNVCSLNIILIRMEPTNALTKDVFQHIPKALTKSELTPQPKLSNDARTHTSCCC